MVFKSTTITFEFDGFSSFHISHYARLVYVEAPMSVDNQQNVTTTFAKDVQVCFKIFQHILYRKVLPDPLRLQL